MNIDKIKKIGKLQQEKQASKKRLAISAEYKLQHEFENRKIFEFRGNNHLDDAN